MKIAEAFVEITAKSDKAEADIRKSLERGGREGGKAAGKAAGDEIDKGVSDGGKRAADSLSKSAKTAAAAFAGAFAAIKIGQFLGDAIGKASDLNEAVSLTARVFASTGDVIDSFAKTSATSVGLSERAFREAAAGLGNLLQNMGFTERKSADLSIELIKLGSDLGSAFNKDPVEALAALQSALIGETEPIRQFGVVLNEAAIQAKAMELGLYSGKGAIDANAKAQATLALITEATSRVQGDFANTSDGLANSQRISAAQAENAAASLGKSFLPIYERAVQIVGALAQAFGALPAPIQVGVVALAGIVALAGPLKAVVDVVRGLATGAGGLAGRLAGLGSTVAGVTAIVGIAAVAYLAYASDKAKAREATLEFVDALKTEESGQEGAVRALIGTKLATAETQSQIEKLGLSTKELTDAIEGKSVPAYERYRDSVNALREAHVPWEVMNRTLEQQYGVNGAAIQDLVGKVEKQREVVAGATTEYERTAKAVEEATGKTKDAVPPTKDLATSTEDLEQAEKLHAAAAAESAKATDAVKQAYQDAEQAASDLLTATLSLVDTGIAAREANLDFAAASDEATKATTAAAEAGGQNALANIAAQRAMDGAVTEATRLAAINLKAAESQATLEGKTLTAAQSAKVQAETLRDLATRASGPLRDELLRLAGELDKVGAKNPKPTLGVNDQASAPVARIGGEVGAYGNRSANASMGINDYATAKIQAIIAQAQRFAGQSYVADATLITRSVARATGGPVGPGSYQVGERGPEILNIDAHGRGSVLNAADSARQPNAQARGGLSIGVLNVGDRGQAADVTEAIDRYWWQARNSA